MEKRKAELIHTFEKDETLIETVLMGDNEVLIILTNKGVYKIELKAKTTATISAIRP